VKPAKPTLDEKELYGVLPKARNEQYDMMEIINRLVDNSELNRIKTATVKQLLQVMRIDGWAVGIV
jgi:acetyl-CoA carboxylase carboxyltransferase component